MAEQNNSTMEDEKALNNTLDGDGILGDQTPPRQPKLKDTELIDTADIEKIENQLNPGASKTEDQDEILHSATPINQLKGQSQLDS